MWGTANLLKVTCSTQQVSASAAYAERGEWQAIDWLSRNAGKRMAKLSVHQAWAALAAKSSAA